MSNRSRRQRARKPGSVRPKISPADQLRTLELYLRYENTNEVGEELGISGAAVRDRLYALDIKVRPLGNSSEGVLDLNGHEKISAVTKRLKREIAAQKSLAQEPLPDILELRSRRKDSALTQAWVARCLGMSQSGLSNLERGRIQPTPELLRAYRDLLEHRNFASRP